MDDNSKSAESEVLEQLEILYSYHAQDALKLAAKARKGEIISDEALEAQSQLKKQIDQLKFAYKGLKDIQKITGKNNDGNFEGLREEISKIKSSHGSIVAAVPGAENK